MASSIAAIVVMGRRGLFAGNEHHDGGLGGDRLVGIACLYACIQQLLMGKEGVPTDFATF